MRVVCDHLDAQVRFVVVPEQLDGQRYLFAVDIKELANVDDALHLEHVDVGFLFIVRVFRISLVKFHSRHVQEQGLKKEGC